MRCLAASLLLVGCVADNPAYDPRLAALIEASERDAGPPGLIAVADLAVIADLALGPDMAQVICGGMVCDGPLYLNQIHVCSCPGVPAGECGSDMYPVSDMASCAPACAPGFGRCGGNATMGCWTDLLFDQFNCGACGIACGNALCVNGHCVG